LPAIDNQGKVNTGWGDETTVTSRKMMAAQTARARSSSKAIELNLRGGSNRAAFSSSRIDPISSSEGKMSV